MYSRLLTSRLLNEPAGFSIPADTIQDFYQKGLAIVQSANRVSVIHDAFLPLTDFTNIYVKGAYENVALDTQ